MASANTSTVRKTRAAVPAPKPRVRRTPVQKSVEQIIRERQRTRERLLWMLTVAIGILLAIGILTRYAYMIKTGYEIDRMQTQLQAETSKSAQLEAQKYQLGSPARILHIATTKLGMQPASGGAGE